MSSITNIKSLMDSSATVNSDSEESVVDAQEIVDLTSTKSLLIFQEMSKDALQREGALFELKTKFQAANVEVKTLTTEKESLLNLISDELAPMIKSLEEDKLECENEIIELKILLEKTVLYYENATETRDLEKTIENLNEQIQDLTVKEKELINQLDEVKSNFDIVKSELVEKNYKLAQAESCLEEVNRKYENCLEQNSKLSIRNISCQEKINELSRQLSTETSNRINLQKEFEELCEEQKMCLEKIRVMSVESQELTIRNQTNSSEQENCHALEIARLTKFNEELTIKACELKIQLNEITDITGSDVIGAINAAHLENVFLHEELDCANKKNGMLVREHVQMKNQLEEANKAYQESLEEITTSLTANISLFSQNKRLLSERASDSDRAEKTSAELIEANRSLEESRQQICILEDKCSRFDALISLNRELNEQLKIKEAENKKLLSAQEILCARNESFRVELLATTKRADQECSKRIALQEEVRSFNEVLDKNMTLETELQKQAKVIEELQRALLEEKKKSSVRAEASGSAEATSGWFSFFKS